MANFKSAHTLKKNDKVLIYDEEKTVESIWKDDETDFVVVTFTDGTDMETYNMGQFEIA